MGVHVSLLEQLPRASPGLDVATHEAIRRLPSSSFHHVVDVGCGTGRHTLILARRLNGPVLAVDPHPPFLQLLRQTAKQAGMEERIRVREAPLQAPPAAPGSIDLLWSEGRLTMGLPTALKRWRPFLRPRGLLVVTAPTWLTDQRPEEAVQFWRACAPEMADAGGTRKLAEAAGFEVLDHLMLPRHGWFEDFYDPLKTILEESRRKAAAQSARTAMLDEAQAEIDLCQRAGNSYSSAHYLLQRRD